MEISESKQDPPSDPAALVTRHLRFGWSSLFLFVLLGTLLEALLGFKWTPYMTNDTRQMLWRLAHAHGTLLGLVHIAFALTLYIGKSKNLHRIVSPCLMTASILIPGGFFAGGIFTYNGDPGMGVLAVPFGACFMIISVFLIARSVVGKH